MANASSKEEELAFPYVLILYANLQPNHLR